MIKGVSFILTFKGVMKFGYLSCRPVYRLSQPRQDDFEVFRDRFSVLALCKVGVS